MRPVRNRDFNPVILLKTQQEFLDLGKCVRATLTYSFNLIVIDRKVCLSVSIKYCRITLERVYNDSFMKNLIV